MTAINGHPLPASLARLAAQGAWAPPHRRSLIGFEDQAQLLGVADMVRNTHALREALASGRGSVFGLSAERTEGLLDPEQIVVIAATMEEEALALDYTNGAPPRVVATRFEAEGVRWVEVAPSFEALAVELGLSGFA